MDPRRRSRPSVLRRSGNTWKLVRTPRQARLGTTATDRIQTRTQIEVCSVSRKAITKKTRFEVFKRDGFVCQYCGNHPPAVLLQVDHINPVKLGGENNMDNLITSCQPCNIGKTATPLSVIPQSMSDKAKEVAEREEQIRGYNDIMQLRRDRVEQEAWDIAEELQPGATAGYPRDKIISIKAFLKRLPFDEVLEAAEIARAKMPYNNNTMFRYFCGICWKKIKEASGQ